MLRCDGYAARIQRQLTARKLRLHQQRLGVDPIPVQVAQCLTGGGVAAPQKRALRNVALGNAPHRRTLSTRLSSIWPDLSRPVGRAEPIKRLPGAGFIPPRSPGKEAAKMNLSKPVNPIRNYAFGSVITALILLSPVFAFLMVIAAEMLTDLLMVGGTSAVCAVAAGSIGLVLSRKFLATSRGGASGSAGTGARRNIHCRRTNVMRLAAGSVPSL